MSIVFDKTESQIELIRRDVHFANDPIRNHVSVIIQIPVIFNTHVTLQSIKHIIPAVKHNLLATHVRN